MKDPALDPKRMQRNLHPTPAAVFAMFHWHKEYAAQRGGSMDFWDGLTRDKKTYCNRAVLDIKKAFKKF